MQDPTSARYTRKKRIQESGDQETQIARDKCRWDEMLQHSPVIAAIRSAEALQTAIVSPIEIIYLLFGNPMNIARRIESVRLDESVWQR